MFSRMGTVVRTRRFAACVLGPVVCSNFAGCVTPISVGRDHFALGVFNRTDVPASGGVRVSRLAGVGLLAHEGRFSLGYCDRERIEIEPDAASAGVVVASAGWVVVTGPRAESLACDPDGVRAFLVEGSAPLARGVLP